MNIRFNEQILIGTRVYGPGEVAEVSDLEAQSLIFRKIAVPAEEVREATAYVVKQARKATRRGKQREARSDHTPG